MKVDKFSDLLVENGFFETLCTVWEGMEVAQEDLQQQNSDLEADCKRAQEALHESEERFRLLVAGVKEYAIFRLTPDGYVVSWNAEATKILGYQAAEIIGQHFSCFFTPGDIHCGYPEEDLRIAVAEERVEEDRWYVRSDSTLLWGSGIVTTLRDEGGHLLGFSKIVRDMTSHKRARQKTNDELELRVENRTTELSKANEQLQREISERELAAAQLKASLQEKEVLLKEVHHRVKNNLQIISSLLNLQSEHMQDKQARESFQVSQKRIESMALIHEKLYQSNDLAQIEFDDYVQDLVDSLFYSYEVNSSAIARKTSLDKVSLDINTAIPCGLIINELISNILKHAFPAGKSGEFQVELHNNNDNQVALIISDNGVGFPLDFDFNQTESLGLQLVNTLTAQIGGTIELNKSVGTEFKITFPAR